MYSQSLIGLKEELKDFSDGILRKARIGEPNVNDGVQVTAAYRACSVAIAHDLEDVLWEEVEVARRGCAVKEWCPKDLAVTEVKEIIEAVKARRV